MAQRLIFAHPKPLSSVSELTPATVRAVSTHAVPDPVRARPVDPATLPLHVSDLLDADLTELMATAATRRDHLWGTRVTYSPKVFIPLTMLCRDACGYCTFAQPPARLDSPYLSPDEVLRIARDGARAGCHEALFTLGENRPRDS